MSLYTHYSELPLWKEAIVFASELNKFSLQKLKEENSLHFDSLLQLAASVSLKIAVGFRSKNSDAFQDSLVFAQEICFEIEEELKTLYYKRKITATERHKYKAKTMVLCRQINRMKNYIGNGVKTLVVKT